MAVATQLSSSAESAGRKGFIIERITPQTGTEHAKKLYVSGLLLPEIRKHELA